MLAVKNKVMDLYIHGFTSGGVLREEKIMFTLSTFFI